MTSYTKLASILIWVCISSFSCKTQEYIPLEYEEKQLLFGSGGGFAGSVTTYALLENGGIFRKLPMEESFSKFSKVSKKEASAIFEEAEFLGLATKKFKHPGNIYYFLTYRYQQEKNEVVWGDERYDLDKNFQQLHAKLMRNIYNNQ